MSGSSPARREELNNALTTGAVLLAAMYIVARTAANQFSPYTGEAAFAGLIAVLLGICVAIKSFISPRPVGLPNSLVLFAIIWSGVFIWAALRSPNPGVGVPLAGDAGIYLLLLLSGYVLAVQDDGALVHLFTRAVVGIVAVEALLGVWQFYIDLPWLQQQVRLGHEALPAALQTAKGLARLAGTDVFGTFGNPNSLAAFLIMGFWLLAGLCWNASGSRRVTGIFLGLLMLWSLVLTHSKGGLVACAAGAWFFAAQRIGKTSPRLKVPLLWSTVAGVATTLALLAAGYYGKINLGASLVERFGYWKAAFAMFAVHPLEGVGLAGFADNFSFFKIALGKETREPHNDYISFLVELGVLGPVIYLALWHTLLRGRPDESTPLAVSAHPHVARAEAAAITGGLLAFALLYVAFQSFNSNEIFRMFTESVGTHGAASIALSLLLPALFVLVIVILRGNSVDDGALWHGLRAGVGAILIHELIDFDFRAQIVIGILLFLAAMMYARRTPPFPPLLRGGNEAALTEGNDAAGLSSPSLKGGPGGVSRLLLPLLSLALAPIVFWIPMTSGLARQGAESRDNDARDLMRGKRTDPDDPESRREAVEKFRTLRKESVALRREALDAAPFDGNAWIDLGIALQALQAADRSQRLDKDILAALKNGERLRPLASYPKIVLGDFFFRAAMNNPRAGSPAEKDLELARDYYVRGAQRYPYAPGFRLLVGDALLMQGRMAQAANEYLEAFRTDMLIDDVNVRLSSIFTDGYAAALPRHGHDREISDELSRQFLEGVRKAPEAERNKIEAGLQIRRMVALTGIMHEARRNNVLEPAVLQKIREELTRSTERLDELLASDAERAHAALFAALSLELGGSDSAKSAAWKQARALHEKALSAGKPGTPPELFSILFQKYAVPASVE